MQEERRIRIATWEERRAKIPAYYAAHRKERQAHQRAYNVAHREEQRAYRVAHPEKFREHGHRRRARLRSQFVAPVDAAAIYRRDRGRCHICGKHVRQVDASMDHLIPISLGGPHAPWNVALTHLRCNLRRSNTGPAQLLLAF